MERVQEFKVNIKDYYGQKTVDATEEILNSLILHYNVNIVAQFNKENRL